MSNAHAPVSTYRVQLHGKWGFAAARAIVPYLEKLGIGWLYVSPILQARRGSTHGYDNVDPRRIRDELGGEAEFGRLVSELKSHSMGLLLDIVPNHMATSQENPAWMDVLTHGRASQFADWFDIAWSESDDAAAIALPVLGQTLDEAIGKGEVMIEYRDGAMVCRCYESAFPVEPRSWSAILRKAAQLAREGDEANGSAEADLMRLAAIEVPDWRGVGRSVMEERYRQAKVLRDELAAAVKTNDAVRECVERACHEAPVREVLDKQPYRLCHWKESMRRVAYRRFFDITHLVGVRVEEPAVFAATHERVLRLIADEAVDGLRIDHIDGLADPLRYLQELQHACKSTGPYMLVEKILASVERLDERWPVDGTTGYEFANALNGVFVDVEGINALAAHQARIVGSHVEVEALMRAQKRRVAQQLFSGEVAALMRLAIRIGMCLEPEHLPSEQEMNDAIIEASARLPVYRTYITREDVRNRKVQRRDRALVEEALSNDSACTQLLRQLLLVELPANVNHEVVEQVADFIVKWQQFTGPLAAKGVEDTALYRDARLVSLNEVGADAMHIERSAGIRGFHEHNAFIAQRWPRTMTCTSTHDAKRSEDVRARLHVLSEIPDKWIATHKRWREMNARYRSTIDGDDAPGAVAELFLYQNIVGAWPVDGWNEEEFAGRMEAYALKASREAKERTNWIEPNEEYEAAVRQFVRGVLGSSEWRAEIERLLEHISLPGALNALSMLALKIASPGVPDFYQGTECWNFSLVDPDNRRPVDYERRRCMLDEIAAMPEVVDDELIASMMRSWRDGRIKMFMTHRGLQLRQRMREVMLNGDYVQLEAHGPRMGHICAFARRHVKRWVVAVAAARVAHMITKDGEPPTNEAWRDTEITLPAGAPVRLRDAITGREIAPEGGSVVLRDALRHLPVALLYG